MRIIANCQWLDWNVIIECNYMPMIPFLQYYFQWYTLGDEITAKNARLQTNIMIREENGDIVVQCGCRSRRVSYDCNLILGVVAEFCNDDFLEKKKSNWCLLHGAAISLDGETAHLFLAPTGMGKSTLAYYACTHGFQFCSDDLIIMDMETGYLLPYPKPIYLRNTDFITDCDFIEEAPWYHYRLLFIENVIKYTVFPLNYIHRPIKPINIHIYERGNTNQRVKLKETDAFQKLLFSSMLITDTCRHNHHLLKLVRQYEVDLIHCHNLNKLIHYLSDTPKGRLYR